MREMNNMPPLDKRDFLGLDSASWLYSGAEVPSLRKSITAVNEYFKYKAMGPQGRAKNTEVEMSLKNNLARLVHLEPKDIALGANTSELLFSLLLSLDWKKGDNIVLHTLEFPAGIIPSLQLKKKGVELRIIEHDRWKISTERILEQVDERTRVVLSSWVSYLSGTAILYREIYRELKNSDTLFIVDVTQALGVFSFDGRYADFMVGSSYKWLLGPHGAGFLAVNPERTKKINPLIVGWRGVSDIFSSKRFEQFTYHEDARRFETGYPSYPTVWALEASTNYLLEAGTENCSRYILNLGDYLIKKLLELNYTIMTPKEQYLRAGNISIICPKGEEVSAALEKKGIYVWGGDGRIRVSINAFVNKEDLDLFIDTVKDIF